MYADALTVRVRRVDSRQDSEGNFVDKIIDEAVETVTEREFGDIFALRGELQRLTFEEAKPNAYSVAVSEKTTQSGASSTVAEVIVELRTITQAVSVSVLAGLIVEFLLREIDPPDD